MLPQQFTPPFPPTCCKSKVSCRHTGPGACVGSRSAFQRYFANASEGPSRRNWPKNPGIRISPMRAEHAEKPPTAVLAIGGILGQRPKRSTNSFRGRVPRWRHAVITRRHKAQQKAPAPRRDVGAVIARSGRPPRHERSENQHSGRLLQCQENDHHQGERRGHDYCTFQTPSRASVMQRQIENCEKYRVVAVRREGTEAVLISNLSRPRAEAIQASLVDCRAFTEIRIEPARRQDEHNDH
jgi:hypothetical protein